jgi:hypothetical protein
MNFSQKGGDAQIVHEMVFKPSLKNKCVEAIKKGYQFNWRPYQNVFFFKKKVTKIETKKF